MKRIGVLGAGWLGQAVDFLVTPCNAAHVGLREIADAARALA